MANALKMKVKIFRPGRYAGASVNDPQFETEEPDEIVEVSPDTAAYLARCKNGEVVTDEPEEPADETETEGQGSGRKGKRGKRSNPAARDKDHAETE